MICGGEAMTSNGLEKSGLTKGFCTATEASRTVGDPPMNGAANLRSFGPPRTGGRRSLAAMSVQPDLSYQLLRNGQWKIGANDSRRHVGDVERLGEIIRKGRICCWCRSG